MKNDHDHDHYLLPDNGFRSDGIEEEIIFGQDSSWDNHAKLDFSPIGSTSFSFDQKSPFPVGIEHEPIVQKTTRRKNLRSDGLDSSNLDLLINSAIEKELIAQMIRTNLKPDGLDSSNLDLQCNSVIEKELIAQMIRENLKPGASNLDPLKEPVVQKTRKKSDSSNLDLQRNVVIEKKPISHKTRKNLKPRHSSNLDLLRNNVVEKEPIAEKTRNNFKPGGFDSNLDLSRSTEEYRPGLPVTHRQLKVSLNPTSLPVESHLVIATPYRTVNSSSLENRASSDPKNPTGTNKHNKHSDYVRRVAKGCRLNRRDRRWRKKEVSPSDGETSTRGKVDDKFGDNDNMNSPAKTTAPTQRNTGAPSSHDNEGSEFTKIALGSTVKVKSVCGSERHPTAAEQLKKAIVPSSRLKWLWPKRNNAKIVFSNNAGKEDFEEVSDCELNDISVVSYTDASEGVDIWRPKRKHFDVRRDKCIRNLCFFSIFD
jgi:hypothetical protein